MIPVRPLALMMPIDARDEFPPSIVVRTEARDEIRKGSQRDGLHIAGLLEGLQRPSREQEHQEDDDDYYRARKREGRGGKNSSSYRETVCRESHHRTLQRESR